MYFLRYTQSNTIRFSVVTDTHAKGENKKVTGFWEETHQIQKFLLGNEGEN